MWRGINIKLVIPKQKEVQVEAATKGAMLMEKRLKVIDHKIRLALIKLACLLVAESKKM